MKISAFSFFCFFIFHSLSSQVFKSKPGENLQQDMIFSYITSRNGLSNNHVYCLYQDEKNFLWIGTGDGLNLYDGYDFKVFRSVSSDIKTVSGNVVFDITGDKNGNILVATNTGVSLLNRETFTFKRIPFVYSDSTAYPVYSSSLFTDRDKNIYVQTNKTIHKYDEKTEILREVEFDCEEYLKIQKDEIECSFVDGKNRLWLASKSFSGNLIVFDLNTMTLVYDSKKLHPGFNDKIFSIYESPGHDIWLATNNGVAVISDDLKQIRTGEDKKEIIFEIFFDHYNRPWIGSDEAGLFFYDRDLNHKYPVKFNKNLIGNSVECIFEDRQGILWIGTRGGIVSLQLDRQKKFERVLSEEIDKNIIHNPVSAIFRDSDGDLWVGTDGSGLFCLKKQTGIYEYYSDTEPKNRISGKSVLAINEDRDKRIWIGGYLTGVNIIDKKTGKITVLKNNPDDTNSLSHDDVRKIHFDKESGDAWIITSGGGVNRYSLKNNNMIHLKAGGKNGLTDNWCISFYEDSFDFLWIGSYWGLSVLNRKTGEMKRYYEGPGPGQLSDNWIYSFAEDGNHDIWIGTSHGLNKFIRKENRFKKYFTGDGLANDIINGVLADKKNNIWVSTNSGISKIDLTRDTIYNYDESDGLQDNQFAIASCFMDPDGKMYFGGLRGFNSFFPDSIKENNFVPPVYITGLLLFFKEILPGADTVLPVSLTELDKITLSYKQSVITFRYAALNYLNPQKNQYAYKLEGLDKNWNFVGNRREATYTGLNPGKYVFRVVASNNDGQWNGTGDSLMVEILPPWWKTTWFRVLLILSVLGIIVLIYYARMNRLLRQKNILEEIVFSRTKELTLKNNLLIEANTLLEKNKKQIEKQAEELKLQKEELVVMNDFLQETNTILEERQQFIEEQSEELRVQTEDLSEKNKNLKILNATKDKFFSIIAHDLKNPFNSVMGFSELLFSKFHKLDDEKKIQYASIIHESVNKIYKLLENLLQWARSQTGTIQFTPVEFELSEIIDNNVELLKNSLKEKGIEVTVSAAKNARIFADWNMINTVVRNILSNAIKFTENGVIKIGMQWKDNLWYLSISDSGTGIPKEKIPVIFEIDKSKSTQGTRGEQGTGLGLIICKEFMEKNKGTIAVTSTEGEGTTFTLGFPVV